MDQFLNSNEWQWRLARTIVQGLLGVLFANLDLIIGYVVLDPTQRALIVALVMSVLSPVMKTIGDAIEASDSAFESFDDILDESDEQADKRDF